MMVEIQAQLQSELQIQFPGERITCVPSPSQGNHLTWNVDVGGSPCFARVEHGPEGDRHLEVESTVMTRVQASGVPVPKLLAVDATRHRVPFAWQLLERIDFPDLNHWHKQQLLNEGRVAPAIGEAVARWQQIAPIGFGPFSDRNATQCYHARYEDYFLLRLDAHLRFLQERGFLTADTRRKIESAVSAHRALLALNTACLVHKDLALWNILGSRDEIAAFIDFDDAVGGDPLDDLSLLACFHGTSFLEYAFAGYTNIQPLPEDWRRRFWLHLLRNMIVKAVIRVGAGYFDRGDGFFLIPSGGSGADLRQTTHHRIQTALAGLAQGADLSIL